MTDTPPDSRAGAKRAWLSALELTSSISRNPRDLLLDTICRRAAEHPDAPALLSDFECFSYRELMNRTNQYARWARAQKLGRGDTVCLLMPNRPEYMAIWLGITSTGCSVALLNTKLVGASLAHCIGVVAAAHIIISVELLENLNAGLSHHGLTVKAWVHGGAKAEFRNVEEEIEALSGTSLDARERETGLAEPITIADRALCIFTSGTTGLPKAVNVSHGRILQWSLWFAGLMQASERDRMYTCLPMYHSVGGIVATGSLLSAGGSVVISKEFSPRKFWADIANWDCTMFQYIGELCRYLLKAKPTAHETAHHIRMCVGNGLRAEIWEEFRSRFRMPQILEFYAATEGSVSLFNVEGEPGSLGRIPPYLAHRFPIELIRLDERTMEPLRTPEGFCVSCSHDEAGEAIGRLAAQSISASSAFEGYTSAEATEKKILRDVFKVRDAWFRTGDLMRRDHRGYYYFVDRIGDTFRWKGENVSTSEVEQVICSFPGIVQACVYGVLIPHADGRAGMATVSVDAEIRLEELHAHLCRHLPDFAHPVLLRLCAGIEMTATFRNVKERLVREGYDPESVHDKLFFRDRAMRAFVPLSKTLFDRIQTGGVIV